MRVLITGATGTVGRALEARLLADGVEVVRWDRAAVPIDDYAVMERFVRDSGVTSLFHLAIASHSTGRANESWAVNYEWTSELAWICRMLDVRFLFASTAMVFSDRAVGPFTRSSSPDAAEGYGYEKRMAEARVFHQNPRATVFRLGWQLGEHGDNTMQRNFDRQMAELGEVRASTRWFPACSFVDDTVQALAGLATAEPGLYMIDGNERWTFFEIASALAHGHETRWNVVASEDFVYDQRLRDERIQLPSLRSRLPTLP
jgi:dTDP-4-dehydrorhamnose reductase